MKNMIMSVDVFGEGYNKMFLMFKTECCTNLVVPVDKQDKQHEHSL